MAYTALYRKYRPDNFAGMAGQEHIRRTLSNQIKSDRVSHAYLFCGTRGTGKTTTAKIFARAINCENPVEGEPCGICEFCKCSSDETAMTIYEIDAASNNGVDNIREIIDTVMYPPTIGKYKVYIIDEVHMLSTGAFNALLKTLEEPPTHVVFILATTEPHKIPATIHSRCQKFDFKRISTKDMLKLLKTYMIAENVDIDDDALSYICRVSDGAMRDALSILDQCLAFYFQEKITIEKVLSILGLVSSDYLFKIADSIYKKDSLGCIRLIDEIVTNGKDIVQFISEIIEHFRNLLVSTSLDETSEALSYSFENTIDMKSQSKRIGPELLIKYVNTFSELHTKIKYASNDRILLEVTCLKLCNTATETAAGDIYTVDTSAIEERLKKLENSKPVSVVNSEEKPQEEVVVKKDIKKAIPEDIKEVITSWEKFRSAFEKADGLTGGMLESVKPKYIEGETFLSFVCENDHIKVTLLRNEDTIHKILQKVFKKKFEIKIFVNEEHNARHKEKHGVNDEFDYSGLDKFKSDIVGINVKSLS